jgi:hypothetical protein
MIMYTRLNGLAMMSVHREILVNLDVDVIIYELALSPRKLNFV